jgi:hypothetical protein
MGGFKARLDDWHGVLDRPIEIDAVSLPCIRELVDRLDAKRHTLLALSTADGNCLLLGGGKGQYVVCRIDAKGHSSTLSVGDRTDETRILLCVGGQIGDYKAGDICSVAEAIRAAEAFLLDEQDSGLMWVAD